MDEGVADMRGGKIGDVGKDLKEGDYKVGQELARGIDYK